MTVPNYRALSIDGLEVFYRDAGRGDAPALLLLHGFPTSSHMFDYASNVALYPAFQAYFREYRPPLLTVWGRDDPFFLPPGAEAFQRDIPATEIRFLDTGHFALETHAAEIAEAIIGFVPK